MCRSLPATLLSACHVASSSPEMSSESGGRRTHAGNILLLSALRIQLNIFLSLSPFSPSSSCLLCLHLLPLFPDFDCSDPLGMESGEITSDQIMASSQYNPSWSPERSRLNYYENAWTPAEDSNKEWIQVPDQSPVDGSD